MNGMEEPMAPQTFLYGCTLESGKDVVFDPEDEFEHQLDLRMVCVDQNTKDEINTVEVEGQDAEGQKVKAVLASLKPSTLPSVCLGGFSITPPAIFRLKAGSGPIHISGQCLVMMEAESSDEEDEDDEEEEEDVDVKATKKRPAASPASKSKKKMKMDIEEGDDDEDEDDEDDEDETMEEESPVKTKPVAAKAKAQNGKGPKQTPVKKEKPTKGKGEKTPKTPPTPKTPLTVPEVKTKITEAMKKGVSLPKLQVKFENFVKHSYKVEDTKALAELWKWKQTMTDSK